VAGVQAPLPQAKVGGQHVPSAGQQVKLAAQEPDPQQLKEDGTQVFPLQQMKPTRQVPPAAPGQLTPDWA
jgi:hypothetical protein